MGLFNSRPVPELPLAVDEAQAQQWASQQLPAESSLNPLRYTASLVDECLCRGNEARNGVQQHSVYVAFLDYDNDEFNEPTSGVDTLLPVNWLATVFGRTNIIHCQLVLWDDDHKMHYTFSVDSSRGVHVLSKKTFAKRGWTFYELVVSQMQEIAVHNFCAEQVRLQKPFSRLGIFWLYIVPYDNGQREWFCSQLCVAALRHANLLTKWRRPAYTIPPHELAEYLEMAYTETTCRNLHNNIVQANLINHEERRACVHGNRRSLDI